LNKILACSIFITLFYSFVCGVNTDKISSSNEHFLREVNEISVEIETAQNEKEKIKLLEYLAEMFIKNNQYDSALEVYNELLDCKKTHKKKKFKYYVKLGDIYNLQKKYSFSLEYYKKALTLYKKNIDVRLKIGDILLKSELYNLAEKFFLEVLEIDKNSDLAKKGLGDVFYYQGVNTKAINYYNNINPENYDKETVERIVSCYRTLKNTDDAVKVLDMYMQKNKDAELFFLYGLLFIDKEEYLQAENMFLNAVKYDKNNFKVHMYLAVIYDLTGEIEKAKKTTEKAYSINSSYAVVDLMLAKIYYKMQEFDNAKKHINNAYIKSKTVFVKNYAKKMLDFMNNK
jgi:tetratricopeptide (TPR) repeat protein